MLVHRGRRIELGQYLPITPVLLGPDGKPAPRARRVSHLPRDPGRSDIEVFVDTPWNMVLHEEGTQTLLGLMNSTSLLLEARRKAPARSLAVAARSSRRSSPACGSMEERAFEAVESLQRIRTRFVASRTKHGNDASDNRTAFHAAAARRRFPAAMGDF